MKRITFKATLACCLYLSGFVHLHAEEKIANSYAVLSLIGDNISLSTYNGVTGSRLVQNQMQAIPVNESVFDDTVVRAIGKTIRRSQPGAAISLLSTTNAALYKLKDKLFDANDASRDGLESLKKILKDRTETRLILITKYRADGTLTHLKSGTEATGKFEGLGFYMDNFLSVMDEGTAKTSTGFLAPFVYLKARLIDAKTLNVIRELSEKQSSIVPNSDQGDSGLSAWNAMTSEQKVKSLQDLIQVAVDDAIPKLLTE